MKFAYSPEKRVGLQLILQMASNVAQWDYSVTLVKSAAFVEVDVPGGLTAGAIAGIVIGAVAFLALVGAGVWFFARKRK